MLILKILQVQLNWTSLLLEQVTCGVNNLTVTETSLSDATSRFHLHVGPLLCLHNASSAASDFIMLFSADEKPMPSANISPLPYPCVCTSSARHSTGESAFFPRSFIIQNGGHLWSAHCAAIFTFSER